MSRKLKILGEQSLPKNGTWAFLGNGNSDKTSERYLFWTSFDTNKVGVGVVIPILIQREMEILRLEISNCREKKINVTYGQSPVTF